MITKLKRENTALIIIDIQEKFLPVIKNINEIIENTIKLIKSFQILKIPIIVTEQYPNGLGKTIDKIRNALRDYKPIEKISFNCFDNEDFFNILKNKKNLVICGIESHVCVTQTSIDGISKGFTVHLIKDAVSSRKESDFAVAIERAKQEGALISSTEMIIFQLLGKAGTEEFKEIIRIIK
jgi:nicotinamidase-related amidase